MTGSRAHQQPDAESAGRKRRRRPLRTAGISALVIVVVPVFALGGFLLAAPVPIDDFTPLPWRPGPGTDYPSSVSQQAVASPLVGDVIHGPEDIAVDESGAVYTGDREGVIWRIEDGSAEHFAEVGGRPLGLAFLPDGRLLVANHGLGLQAVTPDGTVETLLDEVDGEPILFANDFAVGSGIVYLSDSSSSSNTTTLGDVPSYLIPDLIEGQPSGRIVSYDLESGESSVVIDNLFFPNGVALTQDGKRLWVAESTRYRILEHELEGETRVLVDDLPGIPDNLDRDPRGRMLLALYDRNAALDGFVVPFSLGREIMIRLPGDLFVNERNPLQGGLVVFEDDGSVSAHYEGLDPAATSVVPVGDRWYLGALLGQPVRWMRAG